jgi:hypothetical protein
MTKPQSMKRLNYFYVAWMLGAQLQSKYKPSHQRGDDWEDHAMFQDVKSEEEIDNYWLHKVVISGTQSSDNINIIYRLAPEHERT